MCTVADAVKLRNDLNDDAMQMRTILAAQENAEIKTERRDVERRVFGDTKAGIFGSTGQSCPVDSRGISRLIHMPDIRLEEMFRCEPLAEWRGKIECHSEDYGPT